MSTIPGLERPAPVSNDLTKPFWDACNERRLVLQNCTACERLHYPPTQRCNKCGSADNLEWKEVQGKGHIDVYMVDTRLPHQGVPVGAAHQLCGDNPGRGPGDQLLVQPSGYPAGRGPRWSPGGTDI